MVGSKISVAVMDADGNSDLSDETEEVGVYEELEILSAEQTGLNTVQVTFSAPASADDKLTVKKGSTEQTFTEAFDDTTFKTKTLTFKNNLSSGKYTVTLTPADTTVAPSSVEFEAKSATKANSIEIVGESLVMKNTEFEEGYCFIKGYNAFGEEVTLSGLSVSVAPSDSASYDSSTGKVTAKFKDHGYAIVPNVSVFAQYTGEDGEILTAQKTLKVESIGYPSVIEFGEVKKDGGNARADGRITLDELATNKYYVELDTVQDQYGNDLSAEDLNDLADPRKQLLTVIPSAASPIFFGTNATPFSTINGKVVVFITPNNDPLKRMPGTGQLMITSAGGSFAKDIEIEDNPFIDALTVDIPDLYQGERSDVFTFSAVDQYDEEIDLYDFAPNAIGGGKLQFTDKNNLVNQQTSIQAETNGTWIVKKDTENKKFTVRYLPDGDAKQIVTFTTITAGMDTSVQTVTIGALGGGASIVDQGSAYALVKGVDTKGVNLNSKVSFKDANGKVMVRTDCYPTYPWFLGNPSGIKTDSTIKDADIDSYWWCVTATKLPETTATTVPVVDYDADGVIEIGNSDGTHLNASATNATPSYYVSLLGYEAGAVAYKVLDTKAFRFIYSPAAGETVSKYVVTPITSTMYAAKNGYTTKTVEVLAKNDSGETWKPDQTNVSVIADAPFTTSGATVSGNVGKDLGEGTVKVKVYYGGEAVDTIGIAYSDDAPVATSTEVKLETTGTMMGKNWDAKTTLTDFDTSDNAQAEATFADGKLTIKNVNNFNDTLTAVIKDQYDQEMDSSILELNGEPMKDATLAQGEIANFVMTNGSKKIDLELEVGAGKLKTNKVAVKTSATVTTKAAFNAAIAEGIDVITIADNIVLDADTTIKAGQKVIINSGVKVTAGATGLTLGGTTGAELVINGTLDAETNTTPITLNKASKITVDGEMTTKGVVTLHDGSVITVNGNWWHTAGAITGDGSDGADDDTNFDDTINGSGHVNFTTNEVSGIYFNVGGTTMVFNAVEFKGNTQLAEHVKLIGNIKWGTNVVELQNELLLDVSDLGATPSGTFTVAKGASVEIIKDNDEKITIENTDDSAAVTGVQVTSAGTITDSSNKIAQTTGVEEGAKIIAAGLKTRAELNDWWTSKTKDVNHYIKENLESPEKCYGFIINGLPRAATGYFMTVQVKANDGSAKYATSVALPTAYEVEPEENVTDYAIMYYDNKLLGGALDSEIADDDTITITINTQEATIKNNAATLAGTTLAEITVVGKTGVATGA